MPTAQRGEIWQVDLGLAAKVRPALVISIPFSDQERALYAIIPHTTAPRDTRFEVHQTVPGLATGVFDIQGLRSIPASVLVRRIAMLPSNQLIPIESALKLWLGLK